MTDTKVMRITIEGSRASGIEVRHAGGSQTIAGRRVILAAGAIGSPALLLRSGIGPGAHLADAVGKTLPQYGK